MSTVAQISSGSTVKKKYRHRGDTGTLCNQCQSGYYLVASGERRGACEACSTGSTKTYALVVILLLIFVVAYPLSQRLSRVKQVKAYFSDMDEEHQRWWKETIKTLWLTAQTCSLFLSVESVTIPAPFSWLVSAMDFVTLGPLASFFFSPCA